MSSFKNKLARLPSLTTRVAVLSVEDEADTLASSPLPAPQQARLAALKERLDGMRQRHQKARAKRPKGVPLPGALEETRFGRLHRFLEVQPANGRHGHVPIADCLAVLPASLAQLSLDAAMAGVDVSKLVFIDTETTGLAGGAGTIPFLIGAAWFENGILQVEQLVLLRPGEEAPMLQHLAQRLASASAIVSYNGKSYDWPLLRTRFVLNRVPVPAAVPHLDLLHCTRRVFKHSQSSMRLTHIEKTILGFERVDDIDGALIPPTYFSFLRGACSTTLTPILTHNRHDLVALVALMSVLAQRVGSPAANSSGADCLALAQLNMRLGEHDRALEFARAVSTYACATGTHNIDAQLLCAAVLRRRGDVTGALAALHTALEHPHAAGQAQVHLALAKMYEHQLRDVALAQRHAAHTELAEGRAAQEKRLGRLIARLSAR